MRIELGGSYGPELTKRYAADSGIGARIESFTGNARGCYALATVDEERGDLRAWLFTIARQVSQHARRASARRERRQHSVLSFPEDGNPHATLERSRAAQFVNQFLAELDSKQSDVFT